MKYRRKGREFALQCLYALEFGQVEISHIQEQVTAELGANPRAVSYGMDLIQKVLDYLPEVDEKIEKLADNWSFDRIAVIDKILMRCCMAEMLFVKDVPVKVSMTEAIQLAKKYSTEDSAVFINGIMDAAARELPEVK
jgi:N utilization substance protein B